MQEHRHVGTAGFRELLMSRGCSFSIKKNKISPKKQVGLVWDAESRRRANWEGGDIPFWTQIPSGSFHRHPPGSTTWDPPSGGQWRSEGIQNKAVVNVIWLWGVGNHVFLIMLFAISRYSTFTCPLPFSLVTAAFSMPCHLQPGLTGCFSYGATRFVRAKQGQFSWKTLVCVSLALEAKNIKSLWRAPERFRNRKTFHVSKSAHLSPFWCFILPLFFSSMH